MKIEELEARLKVLEDKNRNLQDVEEIKKLQRIYGYYIERGQLDEVADLFSNRPDISFGQGGKNKIVGNEQVRGLFSSQRPFGVLQGEKKPDDYLHITMPVSGVVDVDTDGKTAKARWYALMYLCNSAPGGGAVFGVGTYEYDYIKEDGKWKIWHLGFDDIFLSPYEDGWAKTPKLIGKLKEIATSVGLQPGDVPEWPQSKSSFGDQMPFHYKHPITGKEVKEG
jgi:hypothetical protein